MLAASGLKYETKKKGGCISIKLSNTTIDFYPGTMRWIIYKTKEWRTGTRAFIKYCHDNP
jgi:hypothetical protein